MLSETDIKSKYRKYLPWIKAMVRPKNKNLAFGDPDEAKPIDLAKGKIQNDVKMTRAVCFKSYIN